jgi:hypothetical protein
MVISKKHRLNGLNGLSGLSGLNRLQLIPRNLPPLNSPLYREYRAFQHVPDIKNAVPGSRPKISVR